MNLKIVKKKRYFLLLQKLMMDEFKNCHEKAIRISQTRPFLTMKKRRSELVELDLFFYYCESLLCMNLKTLKKRRSELVKQDLFLPLQS